MIIAAWLLAKKKLLKLIQYYFFLYRIELKLKKGLSKNRDLDVDVRSWFFECRFLLLKYSSSIFKDIRINTIL